MKIGDIERKTQERVIELFQKDLGYDYLGNWKDQSNKNIVPNLLANFLSKRGISDSKIARALDLLHQTNNQYGKSLYERNKEVYSLLRYGIPVKESASENAETIALFDWEHPDKNHFAIAEEVTVMGKSEKRPDLVLYVNGIALAVIELKKATTSVSEGIRQNIRNQSKDAIEDFFTTIQMVLAGNDTEGLRYGTIGTGEKFFLNWKEDIDDHSRNLLDKYLLKICNKQRFLEIIYDFVLFDGGIKKLPRYHQYFGIKSAQDFVKRKESGIIWHTQGSGKSLVMVLLARWILENNPNARVAVITDRDELDTQIERVFKQSGETIYRTRSGKDLISQLTNATPRLLCSLIHKFGKNNVEDFDAYLESIKSNPPQTKGEIFLFIDEAHRTQSGKLHRLMKAILKDATFIGFTGTPLLRKDKQTSEDVFGRYIHQYRFNEAVRDEVVLDLMYEARDIDQRLSSPEKVDEWFNAKTKGLNDYQRKELKKKWGTMQKVLSSKSRMEKIVSDILLDFSNRPALSSQYGNAMLVAGSIYEACKYYKLFQDTSLRGKCAVITSYAPKKGDIRTEDIGEGTDTEKEFVYNTYLSMLGDKDADRFEEDVKKAFIETPALMKLIIVVDKLLTGFDAPACTVLYIDKNMQDHGLFQAICRVNRLNGETKPFGYIVDYKDLFKKVENAIEVYTSELASVETQSSHEDGSITVKDRLKTAREKLEEHLEALETLCEPVEPPKDSLAYRRYFCGNTEKPEDLEDTEFLRINLYKLTATFFRSFANIANEFEEANFTKKEENYYKSKFEFYVKLRQEIKISSGDVIDLKSYEADMRHLIDHYIQAEESKIVSMFENLPLLELVESLSSLKDESANTPRNREASAETIENNIRQKIIRDHLLDPAFYNKMSELLQEIIMERKKGATSYENYLKRVMELAKKLSQGNRSDAPTELKTQGQVALYNNLNQNLELALKLHDAINFNRPDDWYGNPTKENVLKKTIYDLLDKNIEEVERIFKIIVEQPEYR
ncbi:type I restriction endonuclease subunit R [Leptospira levettii]|uniref:Type I restriction enzyme endonuclease subunit n=1 Tax=Leptospira levettii TaxID=2023178 RepID=A0AAW5V697_9LEPT|nr:HsdR family type I site-specific deoxyribonuclease [Leptospira levettii]MCW7512110.1 HsdR family type I site-specific deoxyribonuclease [Leptospira levettii]MCW7517151.1 HsdR family type I site-specific deoxyribonuclease [Leptospira levettii]